MHRSLVLASVLVIAGVALAGCGGSSNPERAAIEAALVRSPESYLHYRAANWWDSKSRPSLGTVTVDDGVALARVSLPRSYMAGTPGNFEGRPDFRVQWALLTRRNSAWRVLDVVLGRPNFLLCVAPRHVMKELAGGCEDPYARNRYAGVIFGPSLGSRQRLVTPAERREMMEALMTTRHLVFGEHQPIGGWGGRCYADAGVISTLDQPYARLSYDCRARGGQDILERTSAGWKDIGSSQNHACADAPPGVIESLVGYCLTIRATGPDGPS